MKFTLEVDTDKISKHYLDMVRYDFNPSGMDEVSKTKVLCAYLMNEIDKDKYEVRSRWNAIDYLELSSIFMVKALTTGK